MANNLDDNIIDKKIEAVLNNSTRWGGSTDKMWKEIEPKIKKPVPWWRGVRAMTAAATAMVVLAAALHYGPWVKYGGEPIPTSDSPEISNMEEQKKANNPETIDGDKKEYENNGIKSPNNVCKPAPHLADFGVKLAEEEFEPGEKMDIEAYVTALKDDIVIDSKGPKICMLRLWTAPGKLSYTNYMLPLAGKSIGAGKTSTCKLSVEAPKTPGWYRFTIQLGVVREQNTTNLNGDYCDFFVKYPEGSIHQGSISINKEVSNLGRTVRVSNIVMTDKNAKINFTISNVGLSGYDTKIVADNGDNIPIMGNNGIIYNGESSVELTLWPLLNKYKKITLEITNIHRATKDGAVPDYGPWKVDIVLP